MFEILEMNSLTLALDKIDVSENTEQISKLFPKCRPRSDINLNPIVASGRDHECIENTTNTIMSVDSENDRWIADSSCNINRDSLGQLQLTDDDEIIIEHKHTGGAYKLRDSRIIEIAGGREIYSQSRSKALRKSRNSLVGEDGEKKNQKSPMRQGVWELRARGETKKAQNSRNYTETVFSSEVCSVAHEKNTEGALDKSSSINMTFPGEVVVFDDIGETWHNEENKSIQTEHSHTATKTFNTSDTESEKVTKVIGNLPIAVYEGSPRRYGQRHSDTNYSHPQLPSAQSLLASPSVYPPRPGFPQRVVNTPSPVEKDLNLNIEHNSTNKKPISPNATTSTFDYLYEFSETRKVLEEFFKCPPTDEENRLEVEFQDLEYELRRQASESGNSYVGQRLAKNLPGENDFCVRIDSPRKCINNSNISNIQDQDITERENNFLDLSIGTGSSGDLGETEVGLQVGHSRNFTLSPETTECDSNCGDLDSEASLMLMENEMGPSGGLLEKTPPPPAPAPHRLLQGEKTSDVEAALKDIRLTLQRTKTLPLQRHPEEDCEENAASPIWVPSHFRQRGLSTTSGDSERKVNSGGEEEENDTDLETDRLLGQQRTDDQGFYDDKGWRKPKSRTIMPSLNLANPKILNSMDEGTLPLVPSETQISDPSSPSAVSEKSQSPQIQKGPISSNRIKKDKENKKKGRNKEDVIQRSVLIEGVLFRARYLGSTQLVCEGQPTKTTRMMQAEEAVSRIKAPDGESQPSTEVDLFISTEKIMVLNTDLKEIMMDHALRTISYIADIGDLVVLMARRRFVPHEMEDAPKINRTPKMICHVFESEEAQFIAQSIGQAFQVAYMEFLKANGIEDHSFVKEMDYQEVLNSQEIFGDELQMFAKKEMQKEVVVPKAKGEILGVVIVESGWGSMLPTVVIANLAPAGAAARCGQLNIGDQIIAINGVSLVGLPLSTCQTYIKNSKNQTVVKLTVVPCAPVVEVKIKRPDTKYQLGFSVQNGVICSLLRGGIAERGGVRVGHRIIEINNQSVVAVPHEKIVNLLATSVGEILMKTMPTSMFRLLTGQENPVYI
ncbi:amyloid-beta A4 precursor protein-binding family A member 2-like isoform X8 [Diabrotica virgifera virgifera]|uniref:Protein lin-10 n=1 Tax=Diabrotica virgifera virgifera TaxID=50390 RepID=A0ABM5L9T9_DIAVI|nr:amyloid-beta A4 precursor protein-binding family A member 2-like isoform X8 [Diabrotica virgifera virgifera]